MANGGDGGVRPCERESEGEERRAGGEGERAGGESEREQGGGVASSRGIEARRGGQAGRERGGVARWRARAGHTPLPLSGRRRQRREVGWAGYWLGQPAGWAAQWRSPGKLLLLYISVFLISDICFDLIKILNHFITLCQFLQELDTLFQSSPTGGIIFGHILIYIINIFPKQIFMH